MRCFVLITSSCWSRSLLPLCFTANKTPLIEVPGLVLFHFLSHNVSGIPHGHTYPLSVWIFASGSSLPSHMVMFTQLNWFLLKFLFTSYTCYTGGVPSSAGIQAVLTRGPYHHRRRCCHHYYCRLLSHYSVPDTLLSTFPMLIYHWVLTIVP